MHIVDALELLTAQHAQIEAALVEVAALAARDADGRIRTLALADLADKLTLHLALEQELLYPGAGSLLSAEVYRELIAEHVEIKRVLAELYWIEGDDDRFAPGLATLQALLAMHETWQESELFERFAEQVPAPRLAELGRELRSWIDLASDPTMLALQAA